MVHDCSYVIIVCVTCMTCWCIVTGMQKSWWWCWSECWGYYCCTDI